MGLSRAQPFLPTLLLLVAVTAAPGCRTGAGGQAVRPAEMTAWEATGDQAGQCRMVSSFGEPLIVDWEAHQRANVEEAMHDGVAVVAYDCKSLRLLKGCRIEGSYGFVAVSKKEQVIRFENADEVAANLPTFGLPLVRQLRGDLARDSTLDLALILVGKKRTTVSEAGREKLLGGGACEGATHFVRGAFVGAFTMGTGTKGEASLGVGLFAASSRSSKLGKYRDGEAESCQQVKPGDEQAPSTCGALLRLELVGLTGLVKEPDRPAAASPEVSCPVGLVLSEGKCTKPRGNEAHQCTYGDLADCTKQCDQGHRGSCFTLGAILEKGKGAAVDLPRALGLYQRTCDQGETRSCNNLAYLYKNGQGVAQDKPRAAALMQRACDAGDANACNNLAHLYKDGEGVSRDEKRAAALMQRACDAGDTNGCNNLAHLYKNGQGVDRDEARAAALFQRACDGGSLAGCNSLAYLYKDGEGVSRDEKRAAALMQRACDAGYLNGCNSLAYLYKDGRGVAQDKPRAAALMKRACDAGDANACNNLAHLYKDGEGVAQDKPRAAALFQRACDGDSTEGCAGLALAHENGEGVAQDRGKAVTLYRKACAGKLASACEALQRLGEAP